MFSLDYPEALQHIQRLPSGLLPFEDLQGGPPKLIVKASKELINTALHRRGFSVYLVPTEILGIQSYSLISAFFDDPDEPFTIFTPNVDDGLIGRDILRVLQSSVFEIYFFDLMNRERLGFTAICKIPSEAVAKIRETTKFSPMKSLRTLDEQCRTWFSERTEEQDKQALQISLITELFPPDLVIIDIRDDDYRSPVHATSLERLDNPGEMQEIEIAECLRKLLDNGEVKIGPLRRDTGRELADIVAWTDKSIIVIQAKDLENSIASINSNVQKKISKSHRNLKGALRQLKGAIKFIKRNNILLLQDKITKEELRIDIGSRTIYGLVVLTELFDYEQEEYAQPTLDTGRELGTLCLPLSFSQLVEYTHELPSEDDFINGICQVYWQSMINGAIPKLRFNYPTEDNL